MELLDWEDILCNAADSAMKILSQSDSGFRRNESSKQWPDDILLEKLQHIQQSDDLSAFKQFLACIISRLSRIKKSDELQDNCAAQKLQQSVLETVDQQESLKLAEDNEDNSAKEEEFDVPEEPEIKDRNSLKQKVSKSDASRAAVGRKVSSPLRPKRYHESSTTKSIDEFERTYSRTFDASSFKRRRTIIPLTMPRSNIVTEIGKKKCFKVTSVKNTHRYELPEKAKDDSKDEDMAKMRAYFDSLDKEETLKCVISSPGSRVIEASEDNKIVISDQEKIVLKKEYKLYCNGLTGIVQPIPFGEFVQQRNLLDLMKR